MILRSLVAGRSFARLPFLCPPHPVVQARTKEKTFLHGILDTKGVSNGHKDAFPQAPKRHSGSPGYSTPLLHSVWTAFFDRCLVRLPTSEYFSPQYGGSWTLESSSLVHCPTTIIALNRTIRDGVSCVSCLTPIPEEWLVERDWYIVNHWEDQFCRDVYQDLCQYAESASLRECLGRVTQSTTTPSATCHSGEGMGESASQMTNLPQVMSPNMDHNPSQDSTS